MKPPVVRPRERLIGTMDHDIRNPYSFEWGRDMGMNTDTVKIRLDFQDLIRDTVRQMMDMEEQARLKVVVEYLRSIGYFVRTPDGDYK